ncbi:MAG: hypothetical protein KIT48_15515 [Pseudolabrys sp.]|nr:hypothetical protein [Pseudolabrys sp.]
MITRTHNVSDYFKGFPDDQAKLEKAFDVALQMRSLEYDLYWKRASFGWVIVGAAITAFGAVRGEADFAIEYGMACLGLIVSFAWYLINRAGASWARNWEIHVEILEDKVIGKLFKSVMNRLEFDSTDFILPYPFSTQRINNILSLTICGVWLFLMGHVCLRAQPRPVSSAHLSISFLFLSLSTALVIWLLWARARVREPENYPVMTDREVRDYGSKMAKYYAEKSNPWSKLTRLVH